MTKQDLDHIRKEMKKNKEKVKPINERKNEKP